MNRHTLPALAFLTMLAIGIPVAVVGKVIGWW